MVHNGVPVGARRSFPLLLPKLVMISVLYRAHNGHFWLPFGVFWLLGGHSTIIIYIHLSTVPMLTEERYQACINEVALEMEEVQNELFFT